MPRRTIVPGTSCFSRAARSASAMPTPAIAIRLCPHPCPMPGSASISAFTPTTRPRAPRLNSARHAVARPRYCRVTVKPCEDMNSVRRSCAYLGRKRSGRLSDQCPGGESKTNLSSKLSSGWSELCICFLFFFLWRLFGTVSLTMNIQT